MCSPWVSFAVSNDTTPWSETFMPASTASFRADSSLPRALVNCVCASRSRDATAFASVWAFWNSFSVMSKRLLAASALRPIQLGPMDMPWTSRRYAVSCSWNFFAMPSQRSAAVVSADRSVVMIS